MPRPITLDEMMSLPTPTAEQAQEFVAHVCWAHSWYKHLPLASGGEFVVFLAADAGAGFEARERLHYAWKTTAEYRRRFGRLDYAWRTDPARPWDRDHAPDAELPAEVLGACRVVLFPFCSSDGNAPDVIAGMFGDDLRAIESGRFHPYAAGLLVWWRLHQTYDRQWQALSDAERGSVIDTDPSPTNTPAVGAHKQTDAAMWAAYYELQAAEQAGVAAAVARLLALVAPR